MNQSHPKSVLSSHWVPFLFALIPAGIAGIVYLMNVQATPSPGGPASNLVERLDLAPFNNFSMPLWSLLLNAFDTAPSMFLSMNRLGACISMGIVYMVTFVLCQFLLIVTNEGESESYLAIFAGAFASGLFVAFSTPQLLAATSLHVASYQAFLALFAFSCLLLLFRSFSLWKLYLVVAIYSLASSEVPYLILTFPLFGVAFLILLSRNEQMTPLPFVMCGLIYFIIMTASCVYQASIIMTTPMFIESGNEGWMDGLGTVSFIMRMSLMSSIFFPGWLLVLIAVVIPFLFSLFMARRALWADTNPADIILHFILTVLIVAVLFVPSLSPWLLFAKGQTLVLTTALMGLVAGYLVAYWIMTNARYEGFSFFHHIFKYAMLVLVVTALLFGSVKQYRSYKSFSGEAIAQLAMKMVEYSESYEWIVMDGSLDSLILLYSHAYGRDIKILNFSQAHLTEYQRYLSSLLDDPRDKSLAMASLSALLKKWMADDEMRSKICFQISPLPFLPSGSGLIPRQVIIATGDVLPPEALDEHIAFWDEYVPRIKAIPDDFAPLAPLRDHMLSNLSRIANELAVEYQDRGINREAFKAYQSALEMNPDNVSALYNLIILNKDIRKVESKELWSRLQALLEGDPKNMMPLAVAFNNGTMRSEYALGEIARARMSVGDSESALQELKHAEGLARGKGQEIQLMLADLFMRTAENDEAQAIIEKLNVNEAQNPDVIFRVALLALQTGDLEKADSAIDHYLDRGGDQLFASIFRARYFTLKGETDRAVKIIEPLQDNQRFAPISWAMLFEIYAQQKNQPQLDKLARNLERAKIPQPYLGILLGRYYLGSKDFRKARMHFERALNYTPGNMQIMNNLLTIDMLERNLVQAVRHAGEIISQDPGDIRANNVLAAMHFQKGELDMAESALLVSLERGTSLVALHDLAWICLNTERYKKAQEYLDKAFELYKDDPNLLDLQGWLLVKQNQVQKGQEFLENALEKVPDHPSALLHMSFVKSKLAGPAAAIPYLERLIPVIGALNSADQKEARLLAESAGLSFD
jgi:tetratricopeptide (TPR) repeat protein